MTVIRISETEILDTKAIQSFKASEREVPQQGGEQSESLQRETVLTLTQKDGQEITLLGDMAESALAILRLHGF